MAEDEEEEEGDEEEEVWRLHVVARASLKRKIARCQGCCELGEQIVGSICRLSRANIACAVTRSP